MVYRNNYSYMLKAPEGTDWVRSLCIIAMLISGPISLDFPDWFLARNSTLVEPVRGKVL